MALMAPVLPCSLALAGRARPGAPGPGTVESAPCASPGSIVARVEVSRRGGWLFVQVATDAGLTGAARRPRGATTAPWRRPSSVTWRPGWPGRVPGRGALLAALRLPGGLSGGGDRPLGVEQALWDLAGQAPGSPCGASWAGACAPACGSTPTSTAPPGSVPLRVRRQRQAGGGAGFRAVKLAPFDDVPRLDTPEAFATIALGIDRVLAVREAVGPEVQVLVDCHCHFNAAWAVRVARRLESARLYWYEDPLPRSDPEGLLRVRQSIEQPVAAGETFFGRRPFWDLFTRGRWTWPCRT